MVSKIATDRAEGIVTTKNLRGLKILSKKLHKELMKEGFESSEAKDIIRYWIATATR